MHGVFWPNGFELNSQPVTRAGSRSAKRHVLRDCHSVHQPHLILTERLVPNSGPPQGRYEQRDNGHADHQDSEFFSRYLHTLMRSHTPSSGGGLAELLHFSLIFGAAGLRMNHSSAQVGDVRYCSLADTPLSGTCRSDFSAFRFHPAIRVSAVPKRQNSGVVHGTR
jgi:hypothetical protein